MKELSIFIDESGNFGETKDARDYYLMEFEVHFHMSRVLRFRGDLDG